MVLPAAVDPQILPGVTLLAEPAALKQRAAGLVLGQAGRLDAVQREVVEGEIQDRAQRLGHVALAGMAAADPVAETGRLRDAAAQVRERRAAEHRLVVAAQDQEAVGGSLLPLPVVGLDPPPEGGPAQGIVRPGRFPGHQEFAALLTQLRPVPPVALAQRAQVDAIPFQAKPAREDVAERREPHGPVQVKRAANRSISSTEAIGPSAAKVGWLPRRLPARLRSSATSTRAIFSRISEGATGRP